MLADTVVTRRTLNIKDFVRASVIGLEDPIVLRRLKRTDFDSRKAFITAFLAERTKAFGQLFRSIREEKTPGMVYPEGQRSPDGEILPCMADLFESTLRSYVEPLLRNGKDPKIGLVTADTLQVFPQGFGGGAPIYRKPLTIRGTKYDASELIERTRNCKTIQGRRMLARWFCEDIRRCLREELSNILEGTQESPVC